MRPFAAALLIAPALLSTVGAGRLAAQEALGAAAFERYVTGKTLYYGANGEVYGAEQYLPGRRVIWAFEGDVCKFGVWFPRGEEICFAYEDEPETHCWRFFLSAGGLRAEFSGAPLDAPLVEVEQSPAPLGCPGPDVGV